MFNIAVHAIPILFDGDGYLPASTREVVHRLADYCQFYLMVDDDHDVRRVESFAETLLRPDNFHITVADSEERTKVALALGCGAIIDDDLRVIGKSLLTNITPIRWVTPQNPLTYGLCARSWYEIENHIQELTNAGNSDTPSRERGWIQVRGRPTGPPTV